MPAAPQQVHDDLVFGLNVRRFGRQIFRIVLRQQFHIVLESLQIVDFETEVIEAWALVLGAEVISIL